MPLYEYQCQQCQHRFEKIQSFSAAPETVCPKCRGVLEKLISAPAIQFKGAGWYVSDYSAKGAASKKASSAESGGDSAASASQSRNGDSSTTSKGGGDSNAASTTTSAATATASPAKTS